MTAPMIPRDRVKKLRKLATMMNTRHQKPFPVTKPLLSCFDIALTPEETDFLIRLGTEPYKYEQAASLSPLPEEEFRIFFEGLVRKGFIWPKDTPDSGDLFALPGIMVGWVEVFLSGGEETPEKREFARRVDVLLKSYGNMNSFPVKHILNYRTKNSRPFQSILVPKSSAERGKGKTIAVGQTIDAKPAKVYPASTVEELIDKYGGDGDIAVVHCFCRHYHKLIDQPCQFKHPAQSCIAFGSLSRYAIKHGAAQPLTKSEAIALIRELQAKGAVHQVFHENEDIANPEMAICNCCWDCCGIFGSYNRGILPLNLHSYYEARVDSTRCTGCATCVHYCPVQAISIVKDKSFIDSRKCIGCGQCEIQCPEEAISLTSNERTVFLPLVRRSEARIRD